MSYMCEKFFQHLFTSSHSMKLFILLTGNRTAQETGIAALNREWLLSH